VWVADVTQHRTGEGWLYLRVVLDVFQRKAVGWAMDDVLNTELVLIACMAKLLKIVYGVLTHGAPFSATLNRA